MGWWWSVTGNPSLMRSGSGEGKLYLGLTGKGTEVCVSVLTTKTPVLSLLNVLKFHVSV